MLIINTKNDDSSLQGNRPQEKTVTTLKPESYHKWRSNSIKTEQKTKKNYKPEKKLLENHPSSSSNFKLIHSSGEYQDNYLENKYKNYTTRPKSSHLLAKTFNKSDHPSTGFMTEEEARNFLEKIEKKAKKFKPDVNLFNIMQSVTRELDNDDETRDIKEKIKPANKLEMLQRIKTQSLHSMQESIKKTELEKMKSFTKNEINKISNEMNYLLDKALRENQVLQHSLEETNKESEELKMENDKLVRRNQILTQNVKELSSKNESLLQEIQKLESFKKSYRFFTEKFPNYSIEKFIDKFNYLENSCMAFSKRIIDLEDDNRAIDRQKSNIEKKIEQIHYQMELKNIESEKILSKFKQENENNEVFLKDNEKFKSSYLEIFKKILYLFSKWTDKIKIFYDLKNPVPPQASIDNPVEMLDILDKIITISTPERLQAYLRKIIVVANVLQRKFFPENVNEKFDPDKIYARIIQKIAGLENQREVLLSELKFYRKKYKPPKKYSLDVEKTAMKNVQN